ncbi:MAG: HAD hydrolase-like protein, partial [Muribaculum sp.]|nr:HAD hydrolase-like protein [Muribaculum sp.]
MKTLAIFDLDGTLLNTIDDLGTATNFALAKLNYPVHPIESYPYMVGNGVRKLIERALPHEMSGDDRTVAEMMKIFKEYYDTHSTIHSHPYPGITDLLNSLNERGVNLAVASNKYDLAVKNLISHFFPEIQWAAVCGQKEGVPVKPDPSIVFDILN